MPGMWILLHRRPRRRRGIAPGTGSSEPPVFRPERISANLFPEIPGFRETVLRYIDSLTQLGRALMSGILFGLGVDQNYFQQLSLDDPLVLFCIFNYPPATEDGDMPWGVGEHTDYGLLTILLQDDTGGLQVKSRSGWVDAPPIPETFVCNIGDMLDRLTKGIYRSTPHRVINTSKRNRLSFPLFFDPNFDARIPAIQIPEHWVSNTGSQMISASDGTRRTCMSSRGPMATTCLARCRKCSRNCPKSLVVITSSHCAARLPGLEATG
jgi:isopenicillin N synthase-like dioxygenase